VISYQVTAFQSFLMAGDSNVTDVEVVLFSFTMSEVQYHRSPLSSLSNFSISLKSL
jgi:hypothetical protein